MLNSVGLRQWRRNASEELLQQKKLQLINAGRKVYDLGMINPDLEPPRFLVDRLQEAVAKKLAHRYSVAKGVLKLREALAVRYAQKYKLNLDPEQNICICAGAKDALVQTLTVLDSQIDYLILPSPTYPSFLAAGVLLAKPCHFYELTADTNELIANIESAIPNTGRGVLVLNFPNNPTGLAVDADFYNRLANLCEQYGADKLTVINDFAYGELAFHAKPAVSLLSSDYFKQHGLEIYSMSKSFCVPGWRIGAVLGAEDLVTSISQLKAHTDFGLFLPIQWAAAAALAANEDFAADIAQQYAQRYALAEMLLLKADFQVSAASAGCSLWAKLPNSMEISASEYCLKLLDETGVLLLPGEVFGSQYNQWLRLALVNSEPDLQTALSNL